VGFGGAAKMSSSRGGAPDAGDALRIMEAAVLRWQYARRRMNQSFDVAFGTELQRLYDEWDALARKIGDGSAGAAEVAAHARAIATAAEVLPETPHPVPFKVLASLVDLSAGDADQLLRLVRAVDPSVESLEVLQPRLNRVETWVATQMPADERTTVRTTPDTEALAALEPAEREALALLLDGGGGLPAISDAWTLDGLTNQVYGVVKVQRGLTPDAVVKGDKEMGAAQRVFFTLVYRLLIDKDAGPRLPTLLLAIGQERARELLGG
jgi:lysyl-tRNA synthetase class 1